MTPKQRKNNGYSLVNRYTRTEPKWWQMQYQSSYAQFRFIFQSVKTNISHPRSARVGWKMDSARRILSILLGWKRTVWRAVAFVVRVNLSFFNFALTSLLRCRYLWWRLLVFAVTESNSEVREWLRQDSDKQTGMVDDFEDFFKGKSQCS